MLDWGVKLIIPEVMDQVSQKTCAPTSRKDFEHSLSGMKGNPLSWIPEMCLEFFPFGNLRKSLSGMACAY